MRAEVIPRLPSGLRCVHGAGRDRRHEFADPLLAPGANQGVHLVHTDRTARGAEQLLEEMKEELERMQVEIKLVMEREKEEIERQEEDKRV
jgi:hypothetical protein